MKEYLPETASQTAGPYVHIGLAPDAAGFHIFEKILARSHHRRYRGERITIEGRVIDGSGTPVRDVLLEIWQANAAGRYNHPDDRQQQKASTRPFAAGGAPALTSPPASGALKPSSRARGRSRWPPDGAARQSVGGSRGDQYWPQHADVLSPTSRRPTSDPVLNLIEWEVRRQTLIAEREVRGAEVVYRFDIHLQGENETVFFDI
jgi:protocatechuate 3,4-dioxygenase alpha subunit